MKVNKMSEILIKLASRKSSNKRESLSSLSGTFGIICNIFLCILKFTVGTISGSVSITADAVNNLSDAGSSIVTLAGARLSNKPVDKEHPFGHGRIEYISALIISFLIFIMGFELGKSSIEKIIHVQEIKFNVWYIIILICAISVKLYMAYFNNKLFKLTDNINLKAVRQDSLNDCIATGATIIALLISSFTPFKRADGIIGLFVAIVIIISGVGIVKDITGKLLGQPPSEQLVRSIEKIMLEEEMILGVHDLIVHDYGPNRIIASAHAEVPSTADITVIHDIIDNIEKKISNELKIVICIHMDPIVMNDAEIDRYKQITKKLLAQINSDYSFHDFKIVKGPTHTNLIFDLVVPFDKNKLGNDVLNEVIQKFKEYDDTLNLVVTVEHSYV